LERPVFEKYPILGEIKTWLLDQPEVDAALMSGSGSTTLAILHSDASEHELNTRAKERYGENTWTFLGRTV
jgi:4-diphosphocytidyl-2-C-methyl-D-erythritol kinase